MAWEKIDDEIIAYISDEFTPSEREAFEQRLEYDVALSDALKRHKAFEEKLRSHNAYSEKLAEINNLNEQFAQKPISQKSKTKTYLFLAAAMVAFLLTIIFLSQSNETYCPDELYTESFETRRSPEYAGQAEDAMQLLRSGHSFFNQRVLTKADDFYQRALATGQLSILEQEEAYFFLGQSKMLQHDFHAALNNFDQITQGVYLQLSQWNSALSFLALGQLEKAQAQLTKIREENTHDRQKEAKVLLEKWNSLKNCD